MTGMKVNNNVKCRIPQLGVEKTFHKGAVGFWGVVTRPRASVRFSLTVGKASRGSCRFLAVADLERGRINPNLQPKRK